MAKCDACGHDAQEIQSSMEKRIKEQSDRIREQKTMLDQAVAKSNELDARVKEFSAREEAITIREAEASGGWNFDERARKLARWAYEDAHEATPAEEKPSFADWLKGEVAQADPILAGYRNAVAPAPKGQGQAPAGARPPTPPQNGSVAPPVRRTLDQINAEVKSVMASGLTPSEKSAKLAELKAQRDQASKAPAA